MNKKTLASQKLINPKNAFTKHFSPTVALILQNGQFINAKREVGFVGGSLRSIILGKIRARLTQPFISTNEKPSYEK